MRELSLAVRTLLRQPTYTLAVVVTLGLALGVTSGFFGVINALVVRPLPGVEPAGMVNLYVDRGAEDDGFSGFSHPTFLDLKERARSLGALEAFVGHGFVLGEGEAGPGGAVIGGQFVSGGFFELLGTRARMGRLLDHTDDVQGGEPVVVISEPLWQRRFGGRSDVLGKTLRINGRPFTLVGVAEPGFRGHFVGFPLDVYLPLAAAPRLAPEVDLDARADRSLELVGRRDGRALGLVQSELQLIARDLAREHPASHRGLGIAVRDYTGLDADLRGPVLGFLAILAVVGALVLLVATVNVAGLVLARGLQRARELAVRAALGASRSDLARPLLAETVVLFGLGGALGAALMAPAAAGLSAFLPAFPIPLHLDLRPDWRVALFTLGVTLASGLIFGLGPAARAARIDAAEALKRGGRGLVGGPDTARRALVAAQAGLSVVLLFGSGLFLRELQRARTFEPGFRTADVGLLSADLSLVGREGPASRAFFEAWLERGRAQPGVVAASLVQSPPLGLARPTTRVLVDGLEPPFPDGFRSGIGVVAPGYFATLGIPLVAGRDFDARDTAGREPVAIVSRATAERFFPGRAPLGLHLRREGVAARVVGVVENVAADRTGARDTLFVYVPFAQAGATRGSLVVRASGPPPFEALRQAARELDPDVPVLESTTLAARSSAALFPQRLAATVTTAFGGLGLLLGGVGLHGLVAYFVERRRHELAVRAALGAGRRELRRLALRQGLVPVAFGLAGGAVAAPALGRLVSGFVPNVGAADPLVFGAAVLALAAVSSIAAFVPAQRAAGASPVEALRAE
jgi:predicted permease